MGPRNARRGGQLFKGLFGGLLLVVRLVEDDRPILRAFVRSLTVEARRVVRPPEDGEQVVEGDDRGVVLDLNDFGVPGQPGANLLISRVRHVAARVSGHNGLHAGHASNTAS